MDPIFTHHDFLVLRTPLLPYQAGLGLTREKIRMAFTDPLLLSALFIATPDMYEKCCLWLGNEIKNEKERKKIELTLSKYLLRASYRCTPFGLFAGLSVLTLGEHTCVRDNNATAWKRHSRLDMEYMRALAIAIAQLPAIQEVILYHSTNTFYRIGDKIRYMTYLEEGNKLTHQLVDVDYSTYLDKVLKRARSGATKAELIHLLIELGLDNPSSLAFVEQMIEAQLLISQLAPTITGETYANRLARVLSSYPVGKALADSLEKVHLALKEIDAQAISTLIERYQSVADQIEQFGVPFDKSRLFQVDVYKPLSANLLHHTIMDPVQKAIRLLSSVQQILPSGQLSSVHTGVFNTAEPKAITYFRQVFSDRYETQGYLFYRYWIWKQGSDILFGKVVHMTIFPY